MPARLNADDKNFERDLAALLAAHRAADADVGRAVREIVAEVRARGDAALIALSQRFDRVELTPQTLRVEVDEIAQAEREAPAAVKEALRFAAARIETYHRKQLA